MLVLSRKDGESIKIGKEIEIQILSCRGKRVKLGIKAPKSFGIQRAELVEFLELEGDPQSPKTQSNVATAS